MQLKPHDDGLCDEHKANFLADLAVAINARASFELNDMAVSTGRYEEATRLHHEAIQIAYDVGYRQPDGAMPALFVGADALREAWSLGADERIRQDLEESAQAKWLAAEQERARLIEARDWEALGLPSPAAVAADLVRGASIEIRGHTFEYDQGLLWFTNPYGQDGTIGYSAGVDVMTAILARLATGYEYGRLPH